MIKLIFTGDAMIGRLFNDKFIDSVNLNKTYKECYGNIYKYLNNSNGVICNLETTITDSDDKFPNKTFNYKLSPKYKNILKYGNIKYVSLANNHILDFKYKGLKDTKNTLDSLNIKYAGIGNNIKEAQNYTLLTINNINFAFISACDHMEEWTATDTKPGIWFLDYNKEEEFLNQIKLLNIKKNNGEIDFIILSLHWNSNYVDNIDIKFKNLAYKLIDNGIDIIHGHSPHHILPIEIYKKKFILYSLGSFIDDYAIDKQYHNNYSIIMKFGFSKNKPPIYINKKSIIIKNMTVNSINKKKLLLKITNTKKIKKYFKNIYKKITKKITKKKINKN